MYKIKFETIDHVKSFVREIERTESDSIIRTENKKYAVDAKSLMGIFSLDLSNNLLLDIYGEEDQFINTIKDLGILVEEV
jgi:phosphotransferase system HPr-like phosphotransfer protein